MGFDKAKYCLCRHHGIRDRTALLEYFCSGFTGQGISRYNHLALFFHSLRQAFANRRCRQEQQYQSTYPDQTALGRNPLCSVFDAR